jgi:glucose-1-phosphate thymidylyltransferase long form
MKALVLAAGKGTRMKHLTSEVPKPLIKINGKIFLDYVFENISKAGINDIGVIVGHKKEMIIDTVRKRVNKLNITFIEQKEQLGTGHAIKTAKDWADGEDFIVIMGDNLYSPDDMKSIGIENSYCYVAGFRHQTPEKFGVLVVNGELLENVIEKPSNPPSNLVNTGLYKFTPEIFDALDNIKKSERGEFEITDAINMLCKKGKVRFFEIKDYWLDLGCPDDVHKVEHFIQSQQASQTSI